MDKTVETSVVGVVVVVSLTLSKDTCVARVVETGVGVLGDTASKGLDDERQIGWQSPNVALSEKSPCQPPRTNMTYQD